jgi:N-acetylglucosamine-6-phosphate deacetylase
MTRISATRAFVNGALTGPLSVSWDATGRITAVTAIQVADAEFDAILVPGFIDLQVNGFGSFNVSASDATQWSQADQYLLRAGVTSWCPTLVSAPLHAIDSSLMTIQEQMYDRSTRDSNARTSIIGAHVEGPFLGEAIGAHDKDSVRDVDLNWIAGLSDCVALITIGAEQKQAQEAIRLLRKKGIAVSIGHTLASEQEYLSAKIAGAQMVTHLYNAMSGVHHRDHGIALNVLTDDEIYASIIVDLEHVSNRAVRLAFSAKPDRMIMVSDSVRSISDRAPRLKNGTLVGSVLSLDQALRNAVFQCSVSLTHALESVTKNPAHVLGLKDRGEIKTGMRADLVLLDENLAVVRTISNGLLNSTLND